MEISAKVKILNKMMSKIKVMKLIIMKKIILTKTHQNKKVLKEFI